MQQEVFIVGSKEYTCFRMNAFAANKLLMRIQKVVLPVLGELAGNKSSLLDLDVKAAAGLLSQHLDEALFDTIVLPMFEEAKVYSVEDKCFIKNPIAIDKVFTTDKLLDLYELVWLVGRFQFEPFFGQLMERFGNLLAAPVQPSATTASLTKD
jgi:hypothetical protein